MDIKEIYYMITNKPYFKVHVLSNGRKVKTFIQLAASPIKTESFFLICKPLKSAWWKPYTPIIDGLCFVTYVDIKNAIPLKIVTEKKYYSTEFVVKEVVETTISEDEEKQKINYKNGMPETLSEISFPPTLLYQQVEAHFVKEILASPVSKWEALGDTLKYAIIAGALIIAYMMYSGKSPLG